MQHMLQIGYNHKRINVAIKEGMQVWQHQVTVSGGKETAINPQTCQALQHQTLNLQTSLEEFLDRMVIGGGMIPAMSMFLTSR